MLNLNSIHTIQKKPGSTAKRKKNKSYTQEQKLQCIKGIQDGLTARQVSEKYGVHIGSVSVWRTQYHKGEYNDIL